MPWYSLGWDVLYYVERALVLYLLIVLAILVATSALVGSRWRAAYDEYAHSGAVQPEEPRQPSVSGGGDPQQLTEGDDAASRRGL